MLLEQSDKSGALVRAELGRKVRVEGSAVGRGSRQHVRWVVHSVGNAVLGFEVARSERAVLFLEETIRRGLRGEMRVLGGILFLFLTEHLLRGAIAP